MGIQLVSIKWLQQISYTSFVGRWHFKEGTKTVEARPWQGDVRVRICLLIFFMDGTEEYFSLLICRNVSTVVAAIWKPVKQPSCEFKVC